MASTAHARHAVFLKHHHEDDPGYVASALERRGYGVEVLTVEDGAEPLDLDDVDLLGILGSKWSIYDEAAVGGWIGTEIAAIQSAHARMVPILGICFGAQALCVALGGRVEPAPRPEIGWVALEGAEDDGILPGLWFQFHADRCIVPASAKVLAANEVCVQAFRVENSLGVQFHPEIDAGQLRRWMASGAGEEVAAAGLDGAALVEETEARDEFSARRVDRLVGAFLERVGR